MTFEALGRKQGTGRPVPESSRQEPHKPHATLSILIPLLQQATFSAAKYRRKCCIAILEFTADTIVVLVDGHIAEIGTHEQLAGNTRVF